MKISGAVEIILLTGFLGAGKTTLLRRLLAHPWEGKGAVVVNDFGAVGVDGEEIRRATLYDLVEIRSGCVCCSLRGQFVESFRHLVEQVKPDRVFLEASGISDPTQILEGLRTTELRESIVRVDVITVVDASFFPNREFLGAFYDRQIRDAGVVLLNKADCVGPRELEGVQAVLKSMNPRAAIHRTVHCAVDPASLVRTLRSSAPRDGCDPESPLGEDRPSFATFSVESREAMLRLGRFEEFLERHRGAVLRAKGTALTENGPVRLSFASHGLDVISEAEPLEGIRLVFVLAEGEDPEALKRDLIRSLGL